MVAPYAQNVQNQTKCPHGFPVGACPICSGMAGGASKDRNKPRVAGEMSYNECLAEWHKILAKKEAQLQERADKFEALRQSMFAEKIQTVVKNIQKTFDTISQKIEALPKIIQTPLKLISKIIIQPIAKAVAVITRAIKNIQLFFDNTRVFLNSVSEKMASIFGEIKNFIDSSITQKYKKAIKTLLSLFTSNEGEEDEEAKKVSEREFKRILKSIFKIRKKPKEKNEKNKLV